MLSTYQTLRARIDDANQQKADREPRLSVGQIKLTERDDSELFHHDDAKDADGRLDAQKQEIHGKIAT